MRRSYRRKEISMAEKTYTEALLNLQNAASEISKQTTSLENSLKLFDEGMKEAEYCKRVLDDANQRITIYENGGEIDA